jgi:hypothetical protein
VNACRDQITADPVTERAPARAVHNFAERRAVVDVAPLCSGKEGL